MPEIICNKAATCKVEKCRHKKPLPDEGYMSCYFDQDAKYVEVKTIKKGSGKAMAKIQTVKAIVMIVRNDSSGQSRKVFMVDYGGVVSINPEPEQVSRHGVYVEVFYKDEMCRIYGEVVDVTYKMEGL